jgi:hypothetical protein
VHRRTHSFIFFCLVLCAVSTCLAKDRGEKLAEGGFETVPAAQLTDPTQSWTLWREPNGKLRLENHFALFEDPALMMMAGIGPRYLDPKLKESLTGKVGLTELEVLLTPDWQPERLVLRGVGVGDGSQVEVVNCKVSKTEVSCRGLKRDAKFKKSGPRELLYSFHFPLLLRSLALRAKAAPSQTATIPVVELRVGKDGPELFEAESKVTYAGEEVLSLGDHRFNARKFSIETTSKAGTLNALLWLSGNDVVLAAQNQDPTLQRVLMKRFKKYSDF